MQPVEADDPNVPRDCGFSYAQLDHFQLIGIAIIHMQCHCPCHLIFLSLNSCASSPDSYESQLALLANNPPYRLAVCV